MDIDSNILQLDDLFFSENEGRVWKLMIASIEKPVLQKLMKYTHGNQLHAARILGINRNTLRVKLRKHGLFERT